MKKLLSILLLLFTIVFIEAQNSLSKDIEDIYGRVVLTTDGQRIIYHENDGAKMPENKAVFKNYSTSNSLPISINADPIWSFSTMGTHIGRNSMHSLDIDNDGEIEMLCSAQYGYEEWMWYLLKFNKSSGIYEIIWNSAIYNKEISCIEVDDIDGDGVYEIMVGADKTLEVFNGQKLSIEKTVEFDKDIHSIVIGDADNDGDVELVVQNSDEIKILHKSTFEVEYTLAYDATALLVGNVDQDDQYEIVLNSGTILELSEGVVKEDWQFHAESSYGYIELSDIDSDNILEVIYAKQWYTISVYDIDAKSMKYAINTDLNIHDVLAYDTNNDGVDEIVYGDAQWGEIHCIDATTQSELWNIRNPEHGVSKINIADVDGDGVEELIWGSGWTSSGSDHLFVADINTKTIEWKSKHIDGPFYAIEIGDVDADGVDEIVTVSYESNSGYDSGIITIFDASNYGVEWQSDGNYLNHAWEGVHAIEICDVDNDGVVEIIIAADRTYDGQIWIINGQTKAIEQSKVYYSEDIDEFSALAISDIDEDGIKDIIVAGDDRISIINSADLSVKWKSEDFNTYTRPRKVLVEDINATDGLEIISCINQIIVIDANTKAVKKSVDKHFVDFDLADTDNDGDLDIVAVTNNGEVVTFDDDLQVKPLFRIGTQKIDGINAADLNGDGVAEYILLINGQLVFATQDGKFEATKRFASIVGQFDSVEFYDFTNDGKDEVIFGTKNQVLILPSEAYKCTWFKGLINTTDPDCGVDNGEIEIVPMGGKAPYTILLNEEVSSTKIAGLAYGSYKVNIQDDAGCDYSTDIELNKPVLDYNVRTVAVGCNDETGGEAVVEIIEGSEPFVYNWSTGSDEASISNVAPGDYEIIVTDSKNCSKSQFVAINKEKLDFYIDVKNLDCNGTQSGAIYTYIIEGVEPISYKWDGGSTNQYIEDLNGGSYSLEAIDDRGCVYQNSIEVVEPEKMTVELKTQPDDTTTPMGEGIAEVVNISGGVAPYFIQWNDPFSQEGPKATNLVEGTYTVSVIDRNNCLAEEPIIIEGHVGILDVFHKGLEIFPMPAKGHVNIENPVGEEVRYKMINMHGGIVKTGILLPNSNSYTNILLDGLRPGNYIIQFILKDSVVSRRMVIQ